MRPKVAFFIMPPQDAEVQEGQERNRRVESRGASLGGRVQVLQEIKSKIY